MLPEMSSYTEPSPTQTKRRAAPSDGAKYPKKTRGAGAEPRESKGTALPSRLSQGTDFLDTFDKPLVYNQLSLFDSDEKKNLENSALILT